jgi:hypothetical protein
MKLIICFCAPAVMESMATTAPTPKIMPSMVSRLRNLCAKRLARPIFSSGRIWPNMATFPPGMELMGFDGAGCFFSSFLAFLPAVGSPSATNSPGSTPEPSTIMDSLRLTNCTFRGWKRPFFCCT